jgi:hypothetical protein
MAKLAYNQLLQCMFVVVDEGLLLACHRYSCQLQSLYDPTPPPWLPTREIIFRITWKAEIINFKNVNDSPELQGIMLGMNDL